VGARGLSWRPDRVGGAPALRSETPSATARRSSSPLVIGCLAPSPRRTKSSPRYRSANFPPPAQCRPAKPSRSLPAWPTSLPVTASATLANASPRSLLFLANAGAWGSCGFSRPGEHTCSYLPSSVASGPVKSRQMVLVLMRGDHDGKLAGADGRQDMFGHVGDLFTLVLCLPTCRSRLACSARPPPTSTGQKQSPSPWRNMRTRTLGPVAVAVGRGRAAGFLVVFLGLLVQEGLLSWFAFVYDPR